MEQIQYDVFISYSRKDYVDEQKNVIPGNIISKIKDALTDAGINYWFDEKGVFSGDEFAPIIAKAIKNCEIFLFVSTEYSNESEWTSNEIATAYMYKKRIIPFLIDDSIYNDSVIMYLAKLDYIKYAGNPEIAFSRLISSIKKQINNNKETKKHIIHHETNDLLKGLKLLDSLREHILRRDVLCVNYQPYQASSSKEMIFFPYMLKEFRCRWFLIGTEYQSMQIRNLALDRIISFALIKDIPYTDNPDFDVMHYFDDVIGVSRSINAKPKEVIFWTSKEKSNYIVTKPLHKSQILLKDFGEQGTLFKMNVIINLELFSVFMSHGDGIRILKPDKIVRHMKNELRKTLDLYNDCFAWIDLKL